MKKKRYCTLLISLALALVMSLTGIFIGNFRYSILDEVAWLCVGENLVRSWLGGVNETGDAYFVNVGYDKQVIDVQVSPLDSGRMVITDRKMLLDFLNIAERADYKYIFLDIRFEKGFNTDSDSVLFAKIASMRDIVIAHHYEPCKDEQGNLYNSFAIADSILLPKTAYNDYYTSVFSSNFTRYPYLLDDRSSVALRMYQDIDGKTVKRCGWFYKNDGTLCENCPFIPIKGGISSVTSENALTAQYCNLGPFLMTLPKQQLIEDMKGKIVVVGDFNEDIHDTYMSMQPGPYLTYLAYKYLASGGNNLSILLLVILTLLYFCIVWIILQGRRLLSWGKYRALRIFTALISWSFFLMATCLIVYLCTGYTFNVLLPSLIISLIIAVKESEEKNSYKSAAK